MANEDQRELGDLLGMNPEHLLVRLRPFSAARPTEPSQIILEDELWFASVRSQDDIFEGKPRFTWRDPPTSDADLAEMIRRQGIPEPTASVLRREFAKQIADPAILAKMCRDLEDRNHELYERSSIASFLSEPFNQELWSRYGNQGNGYGVVFDGSKPWHLQVAEGHAPMDLVPFPVKYVDTRGRPAIELAFAPADPSNSFPEIEKALLSKSAKWKHQDENRMFRIGIPEGNVRFPSEILRAVLLGYNVREPDKKRIIEMVSKRAEPIPVFQLEEHPEIYPLRPIKIA
ncbi:MAG: hypothetical protein A3E01_15485 [Gammaproteobacteria bacterium RIFCSPHIGHO2_12_FULL_63_22]|nr:MAG: hypothetical protein A3E01_15485 [Gammaproteobacteria bacterium RIFCSPHIGHO2_12_FULL_63_22]